MKKLLPLLIFALSLSGCAIMPGRHTATHRAPLRMGASSGGEVGNYPDATVNSYFGTARILADQSSDGTYPCVGCTVNITPAQIVSFFSTGSFTLDHCIEVASTSPLEFGDAGSACGSSSSGVSSFTGDGSLLSNSASTGAVTATLDNTGVGYGVWGNTGSSSGAPGYHALSSYPAAAFPTLNQDTTGDAGGLSGSPTSGEFWGYNGTIQTWITPTAAASSITPGTTTVSGATAPCLIDNSTSTTMGCAAIGGGLALSDGTLNTTASQRTVTTSPTVESTDMGGQLVMNVSGGGTLTIPAISSTVFADGMTLSVVNYSSSTAAVSTTPTVNSGGGCVSGTGIPAGDSWQIVSNGTTLDCIQTSPVGNGSWLNAASSGTSVTPVCNSGARVTVTTVTASNDLTINEPTGCSEGQEVLLKITYSASITYTWDTSYHANSSNPGAIPTSSGGTSGVDFFVFYDDAANSRFDYLADAPAF